MPKPQRGTGNAKVLDADELFNFHDRAAIIRKGSSYGLIDSSRTIIVPYNKYDYIKHASTGYKMLIVTLQKQDGDSYELINTVSKEILPPYTYKIYNKADIEGFIAYYENYNTVGPLFFIKSEGKS